MHITSPHIPLVRIYSHNYKGKYEGKGRRGVDRLRDRRRCISQSHTSYSLYPLINACGKKIKMEWNWG